MSRVPALGVSAAVSAALLAGVAAHAATVAFRDHGGRVTALGWAAASACEFMAVVQQRVPECPDKTVALRAIREAMMQANAAVACNQPQ